MTLDIPLCRTNKGQKSMSFLGPKIWNMLSSNIKVAATTASFTHSLKKRNSLDPWLNIIRFFLSTIDKWCCRVCEKQELANTPKISCSAYCQRNVHG